MEVNQNVFNKQITIEDTLTSSIYTGFINSGFPSQKDYRPQLIQNNPKSGFRVLTTIQQQLSMCKQFDFSIAFITKGGVISLLETLKDTNKRNIPGRILTTDYLHFNEPEALKTLINMPNIQLRIFEGNFHVKGYIFYHEDYCSLIIGSANLTSQALSCNKEWNLKVSSTQKGEIITETVNTFENIWKQSLEIDELWIDHYAKLSKARKENPNWMQLQNFPTKSFKNFTTNDKDVFVPETALQEIYDSAQTTTSPSHKL